MALVISFLLPVPEPDHRRCRPDPKPYFDPDPGTDPTAYLGCPPLRPVHTQRGQPAACLSLNPPFTKPTADNRSSRFAGHVE